MLHTLERARQRAHFSKTLKVDDPFQPIVKEPVEIEEKDEDAVDHEQPFSNCYSKARALEAKHIPSIHNEKSTHNLLILNSLMQRDLARAKDGNESDETENPKAKKAAA